jgi:hypothetical protein
MSQSSAPLSTMAVASDDMDAMSCHDDDNSVHVDKTDAVFQNDNATDDTDSTVVAGSNVHTVMSIQSTPTTAAGTITELELISKLRLAMGATLQMLEATRDNLTVLGQRMDRLQHNSRACRQQQQLLRKRNQEQQQQDQQGEEGGF